MGYRVRLCRFPKKDHILYKNKTEEEIEREFSDEDGYFNFATPKELEELMMIESLKSYKYEDWENFYDFKLCEYKNFILKKEDLLSIIKIYHNLIKAFYNDLYENFDERKGKIVSLIFSRKCEWDNDFFITYNTKDENKLIVSESGIYEHAIFNMVNIYKNFNWEEDFLILNGW